MASYVITGTSKGIGLELVKQLLELPASQVAKIFAITRNNSSEGLNSLISSNSGRVVNVIAEVQKEDSLTKAAKEVESHLGGAGLDVLVNNAGVLPWDDKQMENVSSEVLHEVFDVNVVSVNRVTKAFLPLLEKGKKKQVFNISSTLGSIARVRDWPPSAAHSYRISKAALSMLNQFYAHEKEEQGFTFLLITPGWLKTDLGSSYADLEPAVGVKEVLRIMNEATPEQNGQFLNIHVPGWEEKHPAYYNGKGVPW
ncbi:hypothetical protein PRZ48_007399 [Zasmidium cellare]|uniref:Uncharacterized protein n=1 Tax=Zasmidium cellare TaxID=395010 RepID=A0ABR0EJB9_ZASCE|nr:hypothetical protein PRZ48_007399 [Zasmidium cellare]